jgi:hypothetical protein
MNKYFDLKKYICFLLLFITINSFAQYPIKHLQSSNNTQEIFGSDTLGGGLKSRTFTFSKNYNDTLELNLTFLRGIPNVLASVKDSIFKRTSDTTRWVNLSTMGTSGDYNGVFLHKHIPDSADVVESFSDTVRLYIAKPIANNKIAFPSPPLAFETWHPDSINIAQVKIGFVAYAQDFGVGNENPDPLLHIQSMNTAKEITMHGITGDVIMPNGLNFNATARISSGTNIIFKANSNSLKYDFVNFTSPLDAGGTIMKVRSGIPTSGTLSTGISAVGDGDLSVFNTYNRQGISIGNTNPSLRAALDIGGVWGGVLFPRMTTVQRDGMFQRIATITLTNGGSGYTLGNPTFSVTTVGKAPRIRSIVSGGIVQSLLLDFQGTVIASPGSLTVNNTGTGGSGATGTYTVTTDTIPYGLTIDNIDSLKLQRWNGSAWINLDDAGGGGSYTLPTASASILGGIKVGSGLSIDGGGVLSATGGGTGTVTNVSRTNGYGIINTITNPTTTPDITSVLDSATVFPQIRATIPAGGSQNINQVLGVDSLSGHNMILGDTSKQSTAYRDSIRWNKRMDSTRDNSTMLWQLRTDKYGNSYPPKGSMGQWTGRIQRNPYNAVRPGEILYWPTYNMNGSGGAELANEGAMGDVYESDFGRIFERYLQVINSKGEAYRPYGIYAQKDTALVDITWKASIFHGNTPLSSSDFFNFKNGKYVFERITGQPSEVSNTTIILKQGVFEAAIQNDGGTQMLFTGMTNNTFGGNVLPQTNGTYTSGVAASFWLRTYSSGINLLNRVVADGNYTQLNSDHTINFGNITTGRTLTLISTLGNGARLEVVSGQSLYSVTFSGVTVKLGDGSTLAALPPAYSCILVYSSQLSCYVATYYGPILAGSTNSNIGSGFRFAVPGTNNIKTLFNGYGLLLDSTANTNGITAKLDSATVYGKVRSIVHDSLPNNTLTFNPPQFTISNDTVSIKYPSYIRVTTDFTADSSNYFISVDNGANDVTITLPNPRRLFKHSFIVKRYDNNSIGSITVTTSLGMVQDITTLSFGSTAFIQDQAAYGQLIKYFSNGTDWEISN